MIALTIYGEHQPDDTYLWLATIQEPEYDWLMAQGDSPQEAERLYWLLWDEKWASDPRYNMPPKPEKVCTVTWWQG